MTHVQFCRVRPSIKKLVLCATINRKNLIISCTMKCLSIDVTGMQFLLCVTFFSVGAPFIEQSMYIVYQICVHVTIHM